MSLLITALSGGPLTSSTTADAFQPPASVYARLLVSFGPGSCTIGASTIRCGESKLLTPYSAARS